MIKPTRNFDDMMDCIHADEKWFYLKKIQESLYLLPGEEPPQCWTKSKQHMIKVMFLLLLLDQVQGSHNQEVI